MGCQAVNLYTRKGATTMPKDLSLAYLFDLYGPLLSPRQQELFAGYYDEDLSLSELAESFSVSRQSALQSIQSAERRLREFEGKLGFAAAMRRVQALAEQVEELAETKSDNSTEQLHRIADLARRIRRA